MNKAISSVTNLTYKKVLKPILFLQEPDGVHRRIVRLSGHTQKVPVALSVMRASWAYQNEAMLGQDVAGLYFKNPIGLSAGFDKNFEVMGVMKALGFGFMEGGSMTHVVCVGNPRPWFYRLPKSQSLVVYAGLGNYGSEASLSRIVATEPAFFNDFPLNISVAMTNSPDIQTQPEAIRDYVETLQSIKTANVGQMVTLNISCPNTYSGEPFSAPESLDKLLTEVDDVKLEQPVFIKMPSHLSWVQYRTLIETIAKHKVEGLTISNLVKDRSKVKLKDPLPDSVKGNLSGKPTQAASNELIKRTYREFGERFVISGVGGVFTAEDAYEKIRLGATLVQLVTGLIFEGPQMVGKINQGLVELLKRDGFTHVSQAIGVDAMKVI